MIFYFFPFRVNRDFPSHKLEPGFDLWEEMQNAQPDLRLGVVEYRNRIAGLLLELGEDLGFRQGDDPILVGVAAAHAFVEERALRKLPFLRVQSDEGNADIDAAEAG
jgi:hypothetical protein